MNSLRHVGGSPENRARFLAVAERAIQRGERHLQRGNFTRSATLARRVVAHEPRHLGALELLGLSLLREEAYTDVVGVANRLLALNPYEAGYHSLKGLAMQGLGRYGESAASLRRDPAALPALWNLEQAQSRLIENLLQEDPKFARAYAASPARSLRERGFNAVAHFTS